MFQDFSHVFSIFSHIAEASRVSHFDRGTIHFRETTTRQPRLGLARLLCFLAKHNQPLEQKKCGNLREYYKHRNTETWH